MDHPKCRDCGTRHRRGAEFCPLYQEASKETAKKIPKEVMPHSGIQPSTPRQHKKEPHPQVITEGGANTCPVCEARRLRQIEAQKRYREKKNG